MDYNDPFAPCDFDIGDFVKCSYDYGLTWWVGEDAHYFYGIVLEKGEQDCYFPYGIFYKVLCTDGEVRYFTDWEMTYVSENEEDIEDY